MKPLIVLIIVFVVVLICTIVLNGTYDYKLAGRIGMSTMLAFTAIGHFAFTKGMEMMIPAAIPYKKALVLCTGIIELLAAIGLQIRPLISITGWMLIVFFILIVPANIYTAIKHIDYQKGTQNGPGIAYLWFRVPLQVFFILWVYFSAIV